MSKKNSSVNLKNAFNEFKDLSKIFINFKQRLNSLNKKKYLIGVSGGPDSLALVALSKAYSFQKKTEFHYILVDHNIRKGSHSEAIRVKSLLKKKKINLKIFLNKKNIRRNIQAEARNVRYEIFLNYCKKNRIKTILTAHNLEDQVETFFIRLSRGSGLRGLSSMKILNRINSQISLYRPLLDVKKKFLIKISNNVFGNYIKDPSNKNFIFLRKKVRNLKKSTLNQYLQNIFKKLIKKKTKEVLINFKKYSKLSTDLKLALINEAIKQLKQNYYDMRSKKVVNLINKINSSGFKKTTLGGCIFTIKSGNLCLKIDNS